jgi:transporter family-2 protein
MGVVYVTGSIMIIPRLGAGFAFALMVGGQLMMSLVMDHYGMLGLSVNQVSWTKIAGVGLLVAGVWLIRGK